ncbi:hypothetical protein [Priestia aryabhattai]|uniref:hypothetical protein n=1 Tax=Priestia aryabhattai TaxID=412384 RepID=UPI001C8D1A91|nr:hypothetical protein [Priestia aryabhattai]MBY0213869.1 hypothetical protein [Priestia aryabhattai]
MKTPYIVNYIEEVPLQSSATLYYDNLTQINYLDNEKRVKATRFVAGSSLTTEESKDMLNRLVDLGPETTRRTETIENDDNNYCGPDTTQKTATSENIDHDEFSFLGPDTTMFTKSVESNDADSIILGPETTTETATVENSDINTFILGPDTTRRTFTVETDDNRDLQVFLGPDTSIQTRSVENSDEH